MYRHIGETILKIYFKNTIFERKKCLLEYRKFRNDKVFTYSPKTHEPTFNTYLAHIFNSYFNRKLNSVFFQTNEQNFNKT